MHFKLISTVLLSGDMAGQSAENLYYFDGGIPVCELHCPSVRCTLPRGNVSSKTFWTYVLAFTSPS